MKQPKCKPSYFLVKSALANSQFCFVIIIILNSLNYVCFFRACTLLQIEYIRNYKHLSSDDKWNIFWISKIKGKKQKTRGNSV